MRRTNKPNSSATFYAWLITTFYVIGISTFCAGLGAVRYVDDNGDIFFMWKFWRYALVPVVTSVLMMLTTLYLLALARNKVRSGLFFNVCSFLAMAYMGVVVVWEIIVIVSCNDTKVVGLDTIPVNPHCINRDYPANKIPDVAFLLTFCGAAILFICEGITFWFSLIIRTLTVMSAVIPYTNTRMVPREREYENRPLSQDFVRDD
jgi:hypothetical protein